MSISWGTTENHLQVGIDVSESPSSVSAGTSSVTVTWTVYVKAYYAFEDPQILTLSNALSTTKNYYLSAPDYPNVTTYKIGSWSQTVSTSYTGTVSKTLVASISNVWNGATPSHSRTVTIDKRPPQVPDPPVSADVNMASSSSAAVTWVRPSNASSASDIWTNVVVNRSVNGGSLTAVATLAGTATSFTDTGLLANTTYRYTVYAKNVTGNSSATEAGTIQTTLPIPTSVTPASGATVTVPNPTLGGTFATIVSGTGKLAWQIAKNNTFTSSPITIIESDADLTASGTHTEATTIDQLALSSGTWYIRAWVINNNGMTGPYSAAQSFTVNLPALPVPTGITPTNGSTVTTMYPTLGGTIGSDSAGRKQKMQWQLATNNTFTANVVTRTESDTDFRTSGATTEIGFIDERITMNLGTTWYLRGRTIANDDNVSGWSTTNSFTLAIPAPPAPTTITPNGSYVIATNTPTLGATVVNATEDRTCRVEWQLATDSGFTANVRSVVESTADLRSSGATTQGFPVGTKLFQGTWYIRARQIDEFGQIGSWSGSTVFTVSHPPIAILKTPQHDTTVLYAATTSFTWTFGDNSATDTQTAYQIIIERNDTGAVVLDTGKVASTSGSAALAISSTYKDVLLRWKIRVWDSDNVAGAYSVYVLFTLSDPPVVTITSPTSGSTVTTGQPTFTWTNDVSTTQVSRSIVVKRLTDSVTVYSSGTATTTSQTFTVPKIILANGESYSVTITVTDSVGMTGSSTSTFTAEYLAPDPVTQLLVDESMFDEYGFVGLDWGRTTPDGFFVSWNVYRRMVLADDWTLIFTSTDADLRSYNDWMVPAGSVYEYAVTQSAGRYGSVVESPIVETETREIIGSHYWILNPYDETDNIRLSNVKDDPYSDDYEEAELIIIGRGRKMNHGTRIGYTGTLTCQFRDDDYGTAREKRVQLQLLKAARTTYYLRNPFGDLLQISLGNLSFTRIPGVGTSEFVDVTIPYREVF